MTRSTCDLGLIFFNPNAGISRKFVLDVSGERDFKLGKHWVMRSCCTAIEVKHDATNHTVQADLFCKANNEGRLQWQGFFENASNGGVFELVVEADVIPKFSLEGGRYIDLGERKKDEIVEAKLSVQVIGSPNEMPNEAPVLRSHLLDRVYYSPATESNFERQRGILVRRYAMTAVIARAATAYCRCPIEVSIRMPNNKLWIENATINWKISPPFRFEPASLSFKADAFAVQTVTLLGVDGISKTPQILKSPESLTCRVYSLNDQIVIAVFLKSRPKRSAIYAVEVQSEEGIVELPIFVTGIDVGSSK